MEVIGRVVVLAKQVLSQLSYTPTQKVTLILEHFLPFRNPNPSVSIVAMRTPRGRHLVPIRLMNRPLWSYLRSVRSSEKSVKL